ncbi:MAG: peptidoglycan-binding domain-containing protein [Propionibacteriaceae bacterium]
MILAVSGLPAIAVPLVQAIAVSWMDVMPLARPAHLIRSLPAVLSAAALTLSLAGPAVAAPVTAAAAPATVAAAASTPPVPRGLPAGIESLATYVPANSCSPTTRPGAVKLGTLLTTTYPNTRYGGARGCGALPDSEHHDGRAVDWMNSLRNATQAKQGAAVIKWLLATDAAGHQYANARRLGVMYIIWNGKIWGAYSADRGWRPYSSCATHPEKSWDTTCHRDHMHLSLSWSGASARTSFWTKRVAAEDFGRCRPADLNWAYSYNGFNPKRCPRVSTISAVRGAATNLKTLTRYSGRPFKKGQSGAGVTALQKALGVTASGSYGTQTEAAVKSWQRSHHITGTGRMSYSTWRSILKAKAPR